MNGFLLLVTIVFWILLVLVASMRPQPSVVSRFELKRRVHNQDELADKVLDREKKLRDIWTLLSIKTAFLLVLVTCSLIVTFGMAWGVFWAIVVSLTYGSVSRLAPLQLAGHALYAAIEPSLLKNIDRFAPALRFLSFDRAVDTDAYRRFDSREELQYMIEQSGTILTQEERLFLKHGLGFSTQSVSSIMTPRNVIASVQKNEFLGPLVLSELHDLGHSRLPVIDGDLDHVVGVLYIRDLLSLDNKKSATVEKVMESKVFYIHQDDTLEHALAAFLDTHHHLFIVINDQRETVGLLSLEDVIEALIGRKIVDEDDNHADLRGVAMLKGKTNNSPKGHVDL